MPTIDRSTPIPLYFQLAEMLRAQITSGEFASGDKLPSEHELCSHYDVSRSVVRQALQSLSQDGLIETERGRGAFVRERKVPITLTQKLDPLQEGMAKAGFKLTTKILQQRLIAAPSHIVERIGDEKAIFLERLRYADGKVLLVVQNYLPYSRVPQLLEFTGLENTSLYNYLRNDLGIIVSTGKRFIEIGRADNHIARLLEVEPGSQVLFNRELTYDQSGNAVEYYESWHHPDRTRLTIDLYRQNG
ncbi:GntR family transcriptional regulator [Metarhizobium album]|nr:GntR family transcriptional regulator [Rhizobium album]